INHNKIKYWFNAASIFVLPSYSEGMPTVMFEAMITRNAIIISDVGGVSEVIENNYNGKIISPKDSGELYKELGNLINNDQLRDYLSNNAYKEVKANYTWERNAKKTLKVYNEVLSSE
ncbi:MAG: glycosyltransferase, partial [Candidatus Frackibacter sp. T328-2]